MTIATAPGELNKCEIVWIPILKKYGRHEDLCGQCSKFETPCHVCFIVANLQQLLIIAMV